MSDTRTIHDPFIGKDVHVSDRLTDRLRGRYASGPQTESGPEFGWREFETVPIQHEAAAEIDRLLVEVAALQTELNYFKTEYQDDAGMSMMREQQGFLQAEIARLRGPGLPKMENVITCYDVFQYSQNRAKNNDTPTWVARFPIRKEAYSYAKEMIEGDFTSFHIQEAYQSIPNFQNIDQFTGKMVLDFSDKDT